MEVCLGDWWLSKCDDGKGIAVSGHPIETRRVFEGTRNDNVRKKFHSASAKKRYASRVYNSALIVKRHGCTTVETSDGFILSLCGFINRSRTKENGFSSEVCRDFIYGFPFNWETAVQCASMESNPSKIEEFSECFLPVALDTYNGAQLHNLVLSLNDNERFIFNKKMSDSLLEMLNPKIVDELNLQPSNSSSSTLGNVEYLTPTSTKPKTAKKREHETLFDEYTEQVASASPRRTLPHSTEANNDGSFYEAELVGKDGYSIPLNSTLKNGNLNNLGVKEDLQTMLQPCQESEFDVLSSRKRSCASLAKPMSCEIEENVITFDASLNEETTKKPATIHTLRNWTRRNRKYLEDENNVNVNPESFVEQCVLRGAKSSKLEEKNDVEQKKNFDQSEEKGMLERLNLVGQRLKRLKRFLN